MNVDFEKSYTEQELRSLRLKILDNPRFPQRRDSIDRLNGLIKVARIRAIQPKVGSSLAVVLNRLQQSSIDIETGE